MSLTVGNAPLSELVARAAGACGLAAQDVQVLSSTPVTPRERHDLSAALTGLTGRPCAFSVHEFVELEVRGVRCRVPLTDRAADDLEQALRRLA